MPGARLSLEERWEIERVCRWGHHLGPLTHPREVATSLLALADAAVSASPPHAALL